MDIMGTASPETTEGGGVAHPPPGSNFGYGNWLQPIINANDRADDTSTNSPSQLSPPPPLPQRRGRGRPPVARPRDSSAIEVKSQCHAFHSQYSSQAERRNAVPKFEKHSAHTKNAKRVLPRQRNGGLTSYYNFSLTSRAMWNLFCKLPRARGS